MDKKIWFRMKYLFFPTVLICFHMRKYYLSVDNLCLQKMYLNLDFLSCSFSVRNMINYRRPIDSVTDYTISIMLQTAHCSSYALSSHSILLLPFRSHKVLSHLFLWLILLILFKFYQPTCNHFPLRVQE